VRQIGATAENLSIFTQFAHKLKAKVKAFLLLITPYSPFCPDISGPQP
jgi:hypothetical protein